MTNHTIATPITTWADLRSSDREVLNRTEVATLLAVDPRTVDHAIEDGTLPSIRLGRRVLIPAARSLRFSDSPDARSHAPVIIPPGWERVMSHTSRPTSRRRPARTGAPDPSRRTRPRRAPAGASNWRCPSTPRVHAPRRAKGPGGLRQLRGSRHRAHLASSRPHPRRVSPPTGRRHLAGLRPTLAGRIRRVQRHPRLHPTRHQRDGALHRSRPPRRDPRHRPSGCLPRPGERNPTSAVNQTSRHRPRHLDGRPLAQLGQHHLSGGAGRSDRRQDLVNPKHAGQPRARQRSPLDRAAVRR